MAEKKVIEAIVTKEKLSGNKIEVEDSFESFKEKRYLSFDIIRGLGIIGMVFLHAAVFHYGQIDSIDMDNLNPALMIFYVLIMWGGLFGFISGSVNTLSLISKLETTGINNKRIFKLTIKRFSFIGILFQFLHFIYYMILGPTNYDLESGTYNHSYGFLPGSIRTQSWYQIQTDRLFEQSSLAMIGWILIVLGFLLYFLFRNNGIYKKIRNHWILYGLGTIIILVSFIRITFFYEVTHLIQDGKYIQAWLLSIIGYEPFPIIPYLGYGLIGAAYAISLSSSEQLSLKKYYFLGLIWFVIFSICFMLPDAFYHQFGYLDDILIMYLLVLFQIGFFQVGLNVFVKIFDKKSIIYSSEKIAHSSKKWKNYNLIRMYGTNSLTIFLAERIISNLWVFLLTSLFPGWNNTISVCILFGLGMVVFWGKILTIWRKYHYKYTFEWFWNKLLKKETENDNRID